jgi:RHS repeat-associated protein
MKASRILLAFFLLCGLTVVVAAPAFASAEWLLEGTIIPSTAKAHGESTGAILLRDIKEKSQIECHFTDLWAAWAQFGEITEATTSLCKTTEGPCSSPTATGVDLPWLSELVAVGSEIKNKLLANGKGEPGWQVKCLVIGIEVTDTCKGETAEPLMENTVEGDVLAIFNQAGIFGCTIGGANQGEIKGELLNATLEGLPISVSTEAREFLSSEGLGPSEGAPKLERCILASVNCATGNLTEGGTDLAVGGRGPNLGVVRSYNSLLAASQSESERGSFGYGWMGSYSASLTVNEGAGTATVRQDSGSSVVFYLKEGKYAPGSWVEAKLVKEGTNYLYTLPDQTKLEFNSTGQLTGESDRNGNALTMTYNASKELESVKDGAGRKMAFVYNAEKLVESVKDPMGRTAKYTYSSGNLASVTLPGEEKARWKFEYNASHEITLITDGRSNSVLFEYDESHRVSVETDPLGREHKFTYKSIEGGSETTIVEPNASKTVGTFNVAGEPLKVTRASGTELASTTKYQYNAFLMTLRTDPNEHSVEYGYDAENNRTSEKDANGNERKWKYTSTHDIETETSPKGEVTTIKRDAKGNPEVVERTVGGKKQETKYKYAENGDLTEETDALANKTEFKYDLYGDRESEKDAEGDKRTWEYNTDSEVIAEVSPRGNVEGGEPAKYTTKTERDERGRVLKITDPLTNSTEYTYDGNGNTETVKDPNGNTTKYVYDADNERTEVIEPKSTTKTGYDSEGQVTSHTDGNEHKTEYKRNSLEEITEEIDPLSRKTIKKYDTAGNLKEVEDAEARTTTYKYDPGNRLTEIVYSEGTKPTVKYEYDEDGNVKKMVDSTGETIDKYDEIDRLTESKDAHGNVVKYEYNLNNQPTEITYPNTKKITREYDKARRLKEVKDWLANTTKFTYNPDSQPATTVFPTGTKNKDEYTYDNADHLSEVKMLKEAETLASLVYTRDKNGQVEKTVSKGLPLEGTTEYVNDEDNRLTKAGATTYEYNAANSPTKIAGTTYTYDNASQLEKAGETTYTYNKIGERTKTTPKTASEALTYEYNQASILTGVKRETPEIKDTYTYDGNNLRVSQTINGTKTFLAWDTAEKLPLILNDGTNSYIYGPDNVPFEQINGSEAPLYLHHDQQGSTRLITGTTGTKEGAYTYDAYGNTEEHTGTATTSLQYDAQYTNTDTGLIYLRARNYDPSTAQFLTVDPKETLTRAPYVYASDNPLNVDDPDGLDSHGICGHVTGNVGPVEGGLALCGVTANVDTGVTFSPGAGVGADRNLITRIIQWIRNQGPAGITQILGLSGGVGYQTSNAREVCQLAGPFRYTRGSLGFLLSGSIERFRDANNQIRGWTYSVSYSGPRVNINPGGGDGVSYTFGYSFARGLCP